jgi:hypothetical protein
MDYLTMVVDPAGEATVLNSSEEYRAMFNPDADADADTGFGPQIGAQAWSDGEPPTERVLYRERHSWATVLRRAVIPLGVTMMAAGVVDSPGQFPFIGQ